MSRLLGFFKSSCVCWAIYLIFLIGGIVLSSRVSWAGSSSTNLSEKLLAMDYNNVVFATTHNSYAVFGIIGAANQFKSIQKSLEQGVRSLMLDVHFSDDTKSNIALCHVDCKAGYVEVDEPLETIANFLDKYPLNVITIIWETVCTNDIDCMSLKHKLYDVIEHSRLANMLYAPEHSESPWYTLGEMVHKNEKIVQFSETGPFEQPWDLNMWDYVIETPYNNKGKDDLDAKCTFNRGTPDKPGKLFLNNHFTSMGLIPIPSLTMIYNTDPYMYDRIIRCQQELGKHTTNFVAVDHWSYSDVIKTVACLNGEANVQTCQSGDMDRNLRTIAIFLIGGCIGILVLYSGMEIYHILTNTKPHVAGPIKIESQPLLRGVSMVPIDGWDDGS